MNRLIELAKQGGLGGVVLLVVLTLALPSAYAQDKTWVLTQLTSRGVDQDSVATFSDLLASELSSDGGWSVRRAESTCADVDCAVRVGKETSGDYAIYGSVSALGGATFATVTAVEVASGKTVGSQQMKVDRLADLDKVARRMAGALRVGRDSDDTAELGAITREEARPKTRREGDSGLVLRLGGSLPRTEAGYADGKPGGSVSLGYWYEGLDFALEPSIGVQFDTTGSEATWLHIPIQMGAHYVFSRGDIAPFFGLGAGLHYMHERFPVTLKSGGVIQTSTETELDEELWAFGTFARAGVLFFRTYSVRMALTVDYSLIVAEINGRENPQAWNFGIATIF